MNGKLPKKDRSMVSNFTALLVAAGVGLWFAGSIAISFAEHSRCEMGENVLTKWCKAAVGRPIRYIPPEDRN